jgi:hypothetical protein
MKGVSGNNSNDFGAYCKDKDWVFYFHLKMRMLDPTMLSHVASKGRLKLSKTNLDITTKPVMMRVRIMDDNKYRYSSIANTLRFYFNLEIQTPSQLQSLCY